MKEMYQNINTLIALTKPGWAEGHMKAPVTEMTIGDYLKDQPGFVSSLSISPDEQIYWDIGDDPIVGLPQIAQVVPQGLIDGVPLVGANPGEGKITNRLTLKQGPVGKRLPRAFNISITYTIIEKEMPNADSPNFWGVPKDPLETW